MRKRTWFLVLAAAAAGCFGGYRLYADYQEKEEQKRRDTAHERALSALKADVDADLFDAEYKTEYDLEKLVRSHTGNISVEGEVDTSKVGDYEITVYLEDEDSYGEEVKQEFHYMITVTDTKAPEIVFAEEQVVITEGDGFDPFANIESVKDPADGDLEYSEELKDNSYSIENTCDPDTPGEYKVTVTARDINGNETSSSYGVTVEKKPVYVAPAPAVSSGNPYYIRINRALNTVTIYSLNDKGDYEPYFAMVCSTGAATPLGTYTTFGKSRWRLLYGPCYGQYATDIVGDILFHSVPYYTQWEGDLEYNEYNKLGTSASMGCVRLCVRDALWIYNNCPIGTVVEFYDDWNSPGPLGKPGSAYIDPESPNRGWDPTDPSASNPWNN